MNNNDTKNITILFIIISILLFVSMTCTNYIQYKIFNMSDEMRLEQLENKLNGEEKWKIRLIDPLSVLN